MSPQVVNGNNNGVTRGIKGPMSQLKRSSDIAEYVPLYTTSLDKSARVTQEAMRLHGEAKAKGIMNGQDPAVDAAVLVYMASWRVGERTTLHAVAKLVGRYPYIIAERCKDIENNPKINLTLLKIPEDYVPEILSKLGVSNDSEVEKVADATIRRAREKGLINEKLGGSRGMLPETIASAATHHALLISGNGGSKSMEEVANAAGIKEITIKKALVLLNANLDLGMDDATRARQEAKSSEDKPLLLLNGIPYIYTGESRFAIVRYTKQNLGERFEIELSESRDGPYRPRFVMKVDEGGALSSVVVYDPEELMTICSAENSEGYKKILHSTKEPIEKMRDFAEVLMNEFNAVSLQADKTDYARDTSKELHTLGEIVVIARTGLGELQKVYPNSREVFRF